MDFCEVQVPCHGTWTFKHTDFYVQHGTVQCVSETKSTGQTHFSLDKWKLVLLWYRLEVVTEVFGLCEGFDVDCDERKVSLKTNHHR
jgi:hypothetical protein